MKKLTIILLFAYLQLFCAYSQENLRFERDKRLHFGAGGVIVIIALPLMYYSTYDWEGSINASILLASAFGVGKETLDMLKYIATGKGIGFSWADLSYTVAGAVLAAIITTYIIRKIQKRKKRKWDAKFNIDF